MSRIPPDQDRVPLLVWIGVFIAMALAGASALNELRHPGRPAADLCPHDHTHVWCSP